MAHMYQKILTRTSWGSKQAKEELDLVLPKTNMSQLDVLALYAESLKDSDELLNKKFDQFHKWIKNLNPTMNGPKTKLKLKDAYQQMHDKMSATEITTKDGKKVSELWYYQEELKLFLMMVCYVATDLTAKSNIGRNQVLESFYIAVIKTYDV